MKRIIILAMFLSFANINQPLVMAAEADFRNQQEQAVTLARSGHYDEALSLLNQLAQGGFQPAVWDEIVVLGWAGRYDQAIALFERMPAGNIPDYLRLSAAGSYYRLEKFKVAANLYHQVAKTGNRQAKRWEAESLMRLGNEEAADVLYDQLIADDPQDVDTYLSRGSMRLLTTDITGGIYDLEKALYLTTDPERQLSLRAQIAALYIQDGEYSKGISYLKPAIDNNTAVANMKADYIFALRHDGDFQTAIKEGTRLWPDPKIAPAYGVQALADAYLRNNQPKQAILLYNGLLNRNEEDIDRRNILAGLAYATMLDGQVAQSKVLYNNMLASYPDLAATAAEDAAAMMDLGRYWSSKELFKLIITKFPDNRQIRQQFAAKLASKNMPRDAAAEYAAMAKLPESQPVAGSGLAVNSLVAGDYQTARQGIDQLAGQSIRNPEVAQAVKNFEGRPQGSVDVSANVQRDYKTNNIKEIQISGEQRLGDGLSATVTTDAKSVAQNGVAARYNTMGAGLRYQDLQQEAEAGWNNYSRDLNTTGYHARYGRFFGDQVEWSFALDRLPVDEPLAVLGGIMQSTQRLAFTRGLGNNNSYSLGATRASYSDGNQSFGYDGSWTHVYYDKQDIHREWSTYFSRNSYKYQDINGEPTTYESPPLRESYGFGIRQRWTMGRAYWENIIDVEWSRDHPDTFGFTPHTRLEYGYLFSPNQKLVLGAEYGLRTVMAGGGFWFDYRKYDITYRSNW